MDVVRSLQPRDPVSAARSAAALAAVSAAVTVFLAVANPPSGATAQLSAWVPAVVLVTMVVLLLVLPERWIVRTAMAVPLGGVVGDVALSLSNHDASAAAQISLCLPVLYAASQMRALGAGVVVAAAVVAEGMITHASLSPMRAATDAAYVTAALVSTSWLLVRAGQRQDRLVARLSAAAATDVLTGLSTRRSFDARATAALTGAAREPMALLLVDVDAFKAVNDTWGHPVGDDALVRIASCLRAVVGADAVLGRLGGDEFAAVLPGCTEGEARAMATAMADAVSAEPLRLAGGQGVALSVSVGVAHVATAGVGLREVYADADSDLYRVKHSRLPAPAHPTGATHPTGASRGRREHRDGATTRAP